MLYRKEMVDLSKDTEEARICTDIAGQSLVKGPYQLFRTKIDDSTAEGRKKLKELLASGAKIESVKKDDCTIIDNHTEEGKKETKELLASISIDQT